MNSNINLDMLKTDLVSCKFTYATTAAEMACIEGGSRDAYGRVENTECRKSYVYRLPEKLVGNITRGDMVVVKCATGYQVCEVFAINATTSLDREDLAWVIDKVDLEGYKTEVFNAERRREMRKMIEEEKKRLESAITYDLIAEKNPEFKQMLDAFKAMGGKL